MTGTIIPFSAARSADQAPLGAGFASYKCANPIRYLRRCSRDALIQATLEPEIAAIEPHSGAHDGPIDTFFIFIVRTQGKHCAIALTDTTRGQVFAPPPGCDAAVAIDRASMLAEPVKTTARMIWTHRDTITPPIFIVRLMRRLKQEPAGIRLIDLEDELADEPRRWVDYTLAAACQGLVTLDYRSPLTNETLVRVGPTEARSQARGHWLD